MNAPESSPKVYITYAASDKSWADRMRLILETAGVSVVSPDSITRSGDSWFESIRSAIDSATVLFVLIGPRTRLSKWVDREIELATRRTAVSSAAGLVAVVLPEHSDFGKPYYDPEKVPLRIHDHVSRESAILRKWTDKPEVIRTWIDDALRRRKRFPSPFVSFSTESAIRRLDWDKDLDVYPVSGVL